MRSERADDLQMSVLKSTANRELLAASDAAPSDWGALARYLSAQGMSFDPTESAHQFAGGLANRNYLLTINGQPTVFRRPPDGELPPGAHDMAREHRILSCLSHALSFVPKSLHYCGDKGVIGVPFQLIEYRPGLVVRGADMSLLQSCANASAILSETLVSTLAALHAVDARAVGLDGLGRPQGFVARAIAGWSKRGALVVGDTGARKLVDDISGWLARQRFRERPPTILHCDFKLDNLILDPATLAPVALVDWDMGTRGDPLFDLATLLSYWVEPDDPAALLQLKQMPTSLPGFWRRDDVAKRYAALTGIDLDGLPAMRVLALFKLGVVFLQLHRQFLNGAVNDARYADFAHVGEALLLLAKDIASGSTKGI
ncbi:aminoglycoside phosphotransferase (APT) family kinase protein [Afipia massiliensis]|uniref:Aminoglycoside phosphotransferase (APT) family kinase protein n=1 Tax=Afipia massiliensis TaxID=211460 RepID=A0A840N5K8_9BRAD|nr:phosphotransferase family protein [Afipia massiliensis]MBB5053894.1 aminoglycoside phosphotransferase (APT) family kinase protein [Afipia massiliensis]